jgi:hypothetical protein
MKAPSGALFSFLLLPSLPPSVPIRDRSVNSSVTVAGDKNRGRPISCAGFSGFRHISSGQSGNIAVSAIRTAFVPASSKGLTTLSFYFHGIV